MPILETDARELGLYTTTQVATERGITDTTVRNLIHAGQLPVVVIQGKGVKQIFLVRKGSLRKVPKRGAGRPKGSKNVKSKGEVKS